MNYVLFVTSKLGYEMLNLFIKQKCNIILVCIESEHEHEKIKYYKKTILLCKANNINYILDKSTKQIEDILNNIDLNKDIDYIISFGYRKMISDNIINSASIAALGTHFSPLPRYRGFAPLNWVLINGESETAVNLFYLNKEVDSGDIVESKNVKIYYEDDINSLFENCIKVFKNLMKETIPKLEKNNFSSTPQNENDATFTCSRNPEDGKINWNWNSNKIYNYVRALTDPYPGAFTTIKNRKLYIWSCEEFKTPKYEGRIPGKVIKLEKDKGVIVLCRDNAVLIKIAQLENGKKVTADKIISSIRVTLGNQ